MPAGPEEPDSKLFKKPVAPEEKDPIADATSPAGLRLAAGIAHFGLKYKGENGEFDLDRYLEDLEKGD